MPRHFLTMLGCRLTVHKIGSRILYFINYGIDENIFRGATVLIIPVRRVSESPSTDDSFFNQLTEINSHSTAKLL